MGEENRAAARVAVVGGINLDLLGLPDALVLHESNPGRVKLRAGGVGRNMAAALAACGLAVELIAPLGEDLAAGLLRERCREEGIGLSYAPALPGPSGVYLCLHDAQGDMLAAVNQMEIMAEFTPERLAPILPALSGMRMILADTNLPEETLIALAAGTDAPLAVDPVSQAKARRALPILGRLAFIKPNRYEAETLSGIPCRDAAGVARAAEWFLAQGVARVYLSLGAEGLYYADQAACGFLPAVRSAADYTGAGDRLSARLAAGLLRGLGTREAAEWGMG